MNPHIKATISIRAIELFFILCVFVVFYWLITLNFKYLLITFMITFFFNLRQGRFPIFIYFLTNVLQIHKYFHINRHYEEEIKSEEKTMFTFHPHSIYAYCILMNLNNPQYKEEKLSKMVCLGSRFILYFPIFGQFMKWWGVESVESQNFKKLLKKGVDVGLLPGGYEEATLTTHKEMRIFINERKGFIKYALKYGYTIRPVIALNEHQAFQTYEGMKPLRLLLNKLKIPSVIYWGKLGPCFPPNINIETLVGKSIKGRKYQSDQEPSKEQIQVCHKQYIKQVERMYEKYSDLNGKAPLKFY